MRFKKTQWGWWVVLLDCLHFKVKILKFKKGAACSRQYHYHRNELWLFLKGEGRFERSADEVMQVKAGDWINVGRRVNHFYRAYKKTLVLEIQYGHSCEEMDIVRL